MYLNLSFWSRSNLTQGCKHLVNQTGVARLSNIYVSTLRNKRMSSEAIVFIDNTIKDQSRLSEWMKDIFICATKYFSITISGQGMKIGFCWCQFQVLLKILSCHHILLWKWRNQEFCFCIANINVLSTGVYGFWFITI